MTKLLKLIKPVFIIVFIALSSIGCAFSPDGYHTLTVNNKLVSYSFEYSTYYKRYGPSVDSKYVSPYVYLDLTAPRRQMKISIPLSNGQEVKTVKSSYVPASIEINIYVANKYSSLSAHDALAVWISDISQGEYAASLTHSSITISGIEGDIITYKYDWGMLLSTDMPKLKYFRVAVFDYGGYIWDFTAWSEEEMVEQVKADFEHILETFEILEVHTPGS
jgi:hypothetical protein